MGRVQIRRMPCGCWAWHCGLCLPVVHGHTVSWAKTVANVERHCDRMSQHHEWAARQAWAARR